MEKREREEEKLFLKKKKKCIIKSQVKLKKTKKNIYIFI